MPTCRTLTSSLVVFALGALFAPSAGAQSFREEIIAPVSTDSTITQWTASHVVIIDTTAPHREQLFVYMHGLGGSGGGARDLLRTAAAEGYPAIGLTYPCDWVPFQYCMSADSDCYETLRHEIIDGVDRSPHLVVSPSNSVDNRLARLIERLDQLHPAENWPRFLDSATNQPRWDRVIVWGHSQGGANASVLAKHRVLAGACLSGQATDYANNQPAAWWNTHATPTDRYFGFCHAQDQLSAKLAVWDRQGLDDFGIVRDVATTSAPFNGTHQLSTSVAPAVAGQFHNSVVADAFTPRDALGEPVYAPVWRYMILSAAAASAPGCAADFNDDGGVSVQDIFDFLGGYFTGDSRADFNGIGGHTVQDIFDFLAAYFAGCV